MAEILHRRTRLENTTLNRGCGGRSHTVLSNMPAPVQDFFQQTCSLGFDKDKRKFATSEETAYPMGLAKMLANCIAMALINLGIKAPEETLHQLKSTSVKSLQQMKAATGLQPKASRIPPLVPTLRHVSNFRL